MADSHGQTECLGNALAFFKEQGCDSIYHLGDVCDSAHPETADHCVRLLQQNRVQAIKGNNDHLVVVNHFYNRPAYISALTIEFLQQLPLTCDTGYMVMAHSLPFIEDRGLSSMVGPLGDKEANLFFQMYSQRILLRGHSHLPELVRSLDGSVVSTKLSPGKNLQLVDIIPGIITCGAVDHGFVMVWDRMEETVCSYKLK